MGQVISVMIHKGGVGKSTTAVNLATVLAIDHQQRVLLVDADGQANLTLSLGLDPANYSQQGFSSAVLTGTPCDKQHIVPTGIEGLDLLPGSPETYASASEMERKRMGRDTHIERMLDGVRNEYDLLLMDTPPNLDVLSINAMVASDGILLIFNTGLFATNALGEFLSTLDQLRENRLDHHGVRIIGGVHNRYQPSRTKGNGITADLLADQNEFTVFSQRIHETSAISNAQDEGKPIRIAQPGHRATAQFQLLAKEFEQCLQIA